MKRTDCEKISDLEQCDLLLLEQSLWRRSFSFFLSFGFSTCSKFLLTHFFGKESNFFPPPSNFVRLNFYSKFYILLLPQPLALPLPFYLSGTCTHTHTRTHARTHPFFQTLISASLFYGSCRCLSWLGTLWFKGNCELFTFLGQQDMAKKKID